MSSQTITEDQRDCLQEVINVAMGQASDKLARFLETFVHLEVPDIELVSTSEVTAMLASNYEQNPVSLVSQGFSGAEGLRGEALLIYSKINADEIADLLGYTEDEATHTEQLTDISSLLTTTFLEGLAEQIETQLSYSAPRVMMLQEQGIARQLEEKTFNWEYALKVNISYLVTDHSFNCDMLLLFPGTAVEVLKQVLDQILEDF
ncbi:MULTISPECIES: chemotaxis protein [Corallincola]|uniref:Chemotaxis protein n=3 Tax=Corallincola TaxID=1775176 RepID=A0A368N5A7_9GAMM|nr:MULTISPECIES: chemotaxis protein [Corallincola]RCU45396.1 chemotaxis protein [Corallincola holothuriorum]TAA41095.1 chemotaxis protein [Corallincola spongiicola]TCI02746.1 chemotaxis protein [Corallincola luteus]